MADGKSERRWRFGRVLRWLLPAAILVAILASIDLALFVKTLAHTNPLMAVAGILLVPTRNVIAALRWRMLLRFGFGERWRIGWVFRHYWSGMALGFFTPSSAGLDVYRIAVVSRRTGRLAVNVALVLLEKGLALVSCTALVLAVVPLLTGLQDQQAELVRQLWLGGWALLLLAGVALATAAVTLRSRLAVSMAAPLQRLIPKLVARVRRTGEISQAPGPPTPWQAMLRPMLRPGRLGWLLAASLGIQLASAAGNHVMFQAVGHDVPFAVHLFVVPVLYMVFALPISFGSLGVREGAFIVLYGLLAVPAEIALLVSVLNLAGILLNNAVGAVLLALRGREAVVSPAPAAPTAGDADVEGGERA